MGSLTIGAGARLYLDAIHAATAMAHGCTTFLTNDARFAAIADLPVLLMSDLP